MTFNPDHQVPSLKRRRLLQYSAGLGLATCGLAIPRGVSATEADTGIDASQWTPDYVTRIAGTEDVDTAAECAKVVPLDHKGRVTYWYVGPNDASPRLDHEIDAQFWAAFAKTYPNIVVERQNIGYDQILNKIRVAALGHAAPMVARLMLLWSPELAAQGFLNPLRPEDVGFSSNEFWPSAIKSTLWRGKAYGVPTNNETMALIWNADLFQKAGLDPETPPATWDELVGFAKQIKGRTGKSGYGLVARPNAGNTPYRFMPQCWAYGGGGLDEAEAHPTYSNVMLGSAGTKAALQLSYDMYVRDQSVPRSALSNTQNENQDPFISGQLGMMISHPSEYATMLDRAQRATGDDRKVADMVVTNMRYGLIPKGPVRRAVVFGGWNMQMFKPSIVGGNMDIDAVRAFIAFTTGPEWSTKLAWTGSNPGNTRGFRTKWMKQRLEQIKFLNVTTSMLPSGIPFPVIPESSEIMNVIVPEMMQNALTGKMTVSASCDIAARKARDLLSL